MISSNLKNKLNDLKLSEKIPGVILITGLYDQESKLETLSEASNILEGQETTTAKGNLIVLDSENASAIKVDDVRGLLKLISLKNWDADSRRYVVIPRAELLTVQSSNALLKSLEEAPEGTHFILGAPSKRSLLKTILSRSFILSADSDEGRQKVEANVFYDAFFEKNTEPLSKLSKSDLPYEWQSFSIKLKEVFVSQAYSGELDHQEWHRLFDYTEELGQKIEASMDIKWLVSSIERFGFSYE